MNKLTIHWTTPPVMRTFSVASEAWQVFTWIWGRPCGLRWIDAFSARSKFLAPAARVLQEI